MWDISNKIYYDEAGIGSDCLDKHMGTTFFRYFIGVFLFLVVLIIITVIIIF